MMVVFALAMAAVLGLAVLASSSLQTQVKGNILAAAQADYLAESGLNLGIYYLHNPSSAPSVGVDSVYDGQASVSFGADVPGYVDISVTNVGGNIYDVTATARAQHNLTRAMTARAQVNSNYVQTKALSANGSFIMPWFMSVNGDARVDGLLDLSGGGTITGDIRATSAISVPLFSAPETHPAKAAPNLNEIDIYTTTGAVTPYYNYVDVDGTTKIGYAQQLPALATGTYTAAANNPKNVWYSNDSVSLSSFWVEGTIVLRNPTKRLVIFDTATIKARANMPALVVAGRIAFSADDEPKELVVDGLVWTNANITTTGLPATNCVLQINGALLFGSSVTGVSANYDGMIDVTWDSAKVQVPNFSSVGATPQSVKILRWGL